MKNSWIGRIKIFSIMCFVAVIVLAVKVLMTQHFNSAEDLQEYMKQFGIFAPLILILFQALQVVVPVLPGYLGCVAGAIAFGTATGFWCNYIGISAGSIVAYYLAKRFGINIVLSMFPRETYEKWSKKIQGSKSYLVLLFLAILLPLFPDDFLCYFSGLIRMEQKKFIGVILLGKPWCILAYSILFGMIP